MNALSNKGKIISAWWSVQGVAFIAYFIWTVSTHGKSPAWALTFGIILCLAAYLRLKGEQLRRIADMILLGFSISFAVIAYLIKSHEPALQTTLIIIAVANIAASIASLRRKKDKA